MSFFKKKNVPGVEEESAPPIAKRAFFKKKELADGTETGQATTPAGTGDEPVRQDEAKSKRGLMSFFSKKDKKTEATVASEPVKKVPKKAFFKKKENNEQGSVETSDPRGATASVADESKLDTLFSLGEPNAPQEPGTGPDPSPEIEALDPPPHDRLEAPVIEEPAPKKSFFGKKVDSAEPAEKGSPRKSFFSKKAEVPATTEELNEGTNEAPKRTSFFSKKEPVLGSGEEQKPVVTSKKSFFGKKSEETAETGTPKEKKSLFGKAAPASAVLRGRSDRAYIVVQLRDTTFWEVGAGSITEVGESQATQYISFSDKERRFLADKPVSRKEAQTRAMMETAQLMRVVNSSVETGAFYAVESEHVSNLKHRIAPGYLLLDRLIARNNKKGTALITGFVLTDNSGANLVILFHVDALGYIGQPEITANPKSLEFVISQFTAARKINKKDMEVLLFNNDDLLQANQSLPLYPNEAMLGNIPVRVVLNGLAGVSLLSFAGAAGFAGLQHQKNQSLAKEVARLKGSVQAQNRANSELLSERIGSFAKQMSIDEAAGFQRAERIWVPESKLTMEATRTGTTYVLALPLISNRLLNGKPSPSAVQDPEEVLRMMRLMVPQDCVRNDVAITGSMNEIQLTIDCPNGNTSMSSFSND